MSLQLTVAELARNNFQSYIIPTYFTFLFAACSSIYSPCFEAPPSERLSSNLPIAVYGMDIDIVHLLQWLQNIAENSNHQPQRRNKALYIAASFNVHRNSTRLMAQIAEFATGDTDFFHCHRIGRTTEMVEKAVDRHIERLQSVVAEFGAIPNVADFEGHAIELISTLPDGIENLLDTEKKLEFHRDLLHLETEANKTLDEYTSRYGYHYIFRAGLRNYYMT